MASTSNEEDQSMIQHYNADCASVSKIKDVCQDGENNSDNNELKTFYNTEEGITAYTTNSKGVQCFLAIVIVFVSVLNGIPSGYRAILLPQLALENGTLYVDQEYGSWIGTMYNLATGIGSLLAGPLLEGIGRRGCIQFGLIPHIIGWLFIGFANNTSCILAGRILSGLAIGLTSIPSVVLLSEITDPGSRAFVTSGFFALLCFGVLLVYGFGALFKWTDIAYICSTFPAVMFVVLTFVPESPVWLVKRRKLGKARKALLQLRGNDFKQANIEVEVLYERIHARKGPNMSFKDKLRSEVLTILDPGVWKPLIIMNTLSLLCSFSGAYVATFYMVDLVKDIGGDSVDIYLATIVTVAIGFVFALIMCYLFLKKGRRPLGILLAVITLLSSIVLASYEVSIVHPTYIDDYVLCGCLLIYVASNTVGLLILIGVLNGELFPFRARGIACGYSFFFLNIMMFLSAKCFPLIDSAVGKAGAFGIFGVLAFLVAIFIYFFVPETKDRTLQEIEDHFQRNNLMSITKPRLRKDSKNHIEST